MTATQAQYAVNAALATLDRDRREPPSFEKILRTVEKFDYTTARDNVTAPLSYPGHEGRVTFYLKHVDKDALEVANAVYRLGGPKKNTPATTWRLVIEWRRTHPFEGGIRVTAQVKP